ncbi:SseB family protein [Ruminococcus sp. YE71]|uniref:SseB family protein n=2 Tax=unclassified Ruminococcus TaxID=2608920 RepID=UPI001FA81B49|nr:SseB family protein [Ruminococcus sp. YE71]
MAEALFGVPDEIAAECRKRLPDDINAVLDRFNELRIPAIPPFHDEFLDGNTLIEQAIADYYADDSKEKLLAVLEAIRQCMHADRHFIILVIVNEEDDNTVAFRTLQTNDGKLWHVVFTSQEEYEKGKNSAVISHFIDSTLQSCLKTEATGYIINPWGQSFMLTKELIQMIYEADGGVEYTVFDEPITEELLEDGSFLKKAIEICNRNRTKLNLIKLARILRDSYVWIPCNAILSDEDYEIWSKAVLDAADNGDMGSLIGREFTSHDNIRMVPDILQNDDNFFFPVFTSDEEMGEYGEHFSKIQHHFLEAMNLARNNEKNVCGIVVNAFSESFVIPIELFDIIADMDSSIE